MTQDQIFLIELNDLYATVVRYLALKGPCIRRGEDITQTEERIASKIEAFTQRVEEAGYMPTLSLCSEWNSFAKLVGLARLLQPNHSTRFVTQVCFSLNNTTLIWYKYVRKN